MRRLSKKSSPQSVSITLKLTKTQAMSRVRKKMKTYAASFLVSSTDKFKFRFVETVNQFTFNDDDRWHVTNIIYGDSEVVPHKRMRDLNCGGRTTHVEGQRVCVGDNVDVNFAGRGQWYPAHVTKVYHNTYDLQYAGEMKIPKLSLTLTTNPNPNP